MIYDVFLPFVIIFSIFSIIIILARKIPDISLEAEEKKDWLTEEAKKQNRTTVLFCKLLTILEKTLRQLRIHILKLDAKIFSLIQYLREKSAKKLEEINKLSYKNFVSVAEKKADKIQTKEKSPVVKNDIFPVSSIKAAPVVNFLLTHKIAKTSGRSDNVSIKFQFKIEERKLLQIIAKNPKKADNYKKLGVLYLKNDNLADAEASFSEYLKRNPFDAEANKILENMRLK